MRKYFDAIQPIAGNVVTVNAAGVGYDELAVISSARGDSLAQVIRLEGQQVSLQVFAGSQGVSNNDRVRFLHRPMQVPFSDELARPRVRRFGPAARRPRPGHRRDDRHRFAGGQPGPAAHARPDGRRPASR